MDISRELGLAIADLLERLALAIRIRDREEALRLWHATPLRRLVIRMLRNQERRKWPRQPLTPRPDESLADYFSRCGR